MSLQTQPQSAATVYVEDQILSETPVARVARIYEMARTALVRARTALAQNNQRTKGIAVDRALRCVALLQSSLNLEAGGEVAENLDRLYGYVVARISEAHRANDDEMFAEVADHLAELGGAWREAAARETSPRPAVGV